MKDMPTMVISTGTFPAAPKGTRAGAADADAGVAIVDTVGGTSTFLVAFGTVMFLTAGVAADASPDTPRLMPEAGPAAPPVALPLPSLFGCLFVSICMATWGRSVGWLGV